MVSKCSAKNINILKIIWYKGTFLQSMHIVLIKTVEFCWIPAFLTDCFASCEIQILLNKTKYRKRKN